MNFLRRLFSGSGRSQDDGFYVYVQPKACQEILRVRIDLKNSLSLKDDGSGYFVRKMASGARCPFAVEMRLEFDSNRNMIGKSIENGEYVTEEDYRAKYGETDTADA